MLREEEITEEIEVIMLSAEQLRDEDGNDQRNPRGPA